MKEPIPFLANSFFSKLMPIGLTIFFMLSGCTRLEPRVVVVTATPTTGTEMVSPISTDVQSTTFVVATSISVTAPPSTTETYTVQPGDTLTSIAAQYGVRMETLLKLNSLADPNVLSVGQVLVIPRSPIESPQAFKVIPDSRFIRGPGSAAFDIAAFVGRQQGYIRSAVDIVDEVQLSASELIQRVSLEYSVDPRLLLALLEYRSHWLTQAVVSDALEMFPIQGGPSPDGYDRSGLYKQLSWVANELNAGYYGWKYKGIESIEFSDGTRLRIAQGLNAGTIGIQFLFSFLGGYEDWLPAVSSEGILQTYVSLFGDPFTEELPMQVLTQLSQPDLTFPFPSGQTWFFTGGPHGGWGSGSAWAAIDFAPPDDRPEGSSPCYISSFTATSVASGIIARSDKGAVILDLDGDGDESTGWTILYLHMASDGRIAPGTRVVTGDSIGRPSCEGGFSNATHMHIARRFNGEWIPVICDVCNTTNSPPPWIMNGWTVLGYASQEYQGYMINGGERREAEQGRLTPINRISW